MVTARASNAPVEQDCSEVRRLGRHSTSVKGDRESKLSIDKASTGCTCPVLFAEEAFFRTCVVDSSLTPFL
jgi:hypothetical protein